MNNLSYDLAAESFSYDPDLGVVTNKITRNSKSIADTQAGCLHHTGYIYIEINGTSYGAHRIAWLLFNGFIPDNKEIDHINGNRSDNRIENLRLVTRQQNTKNQKRRSTNNSGFTGVCWDKSRSRWLAYISANGKRKKLGLHRNLDDAVSARKMAEKIYGYHENHGREE